MIDSHAHGRRRRRVRAALAGAGLVAVAATVLNVTSPPATAALAPADRTGIRTPAGFADLVEAVEPAVVHVAVEGSALVARGTPGLPQGLPGPMREFLERHFEGAPQAGPMPTQGVGSGFIVSPDGHVVTSDHVVARADEVTVTTSDGRSLPARVVGRDEKTDLALLLVETDEELPWLEFGSAEDTRVGDWVVAVGSPFGLGGTVTAGILSARGRDIGSGPYDDYLQVDAPINRGNSGGPLFDRSGKVIGVNTAIFSPSGGNIGIGFAVPAEVAAPVVASLRENGRVERGWLGVEIQPVTETMADALGLDAAEGALVANVRPDSPAERAGLEAGDVILGFGGEPIEELRDLPILVARTEAGATQTVEIRRDGERLDLDVTIGAMPGSDGATTLSHTDGGASGDSPALGLALARAEDGVGVVVARVASGSPAAEGGLRPGDRILRVGRREVRDPQDVVAAVRDAERSDRDAVLVQVRRGEAERFLALRLGAA